jgi:hypothetical protein
MARGAIGATAPTLACRVVRPTRAPAAIALGGTRARRRAELETRVAPAAHRHDCFAAATLAISKQHEQHADPARAAVNWTTTAGP